MDHHGLEADRAQQDHVLGEGPRQVRVDHGIAAELHHDHRTAELLDVGQGLDQGLGTEFGCVAAVAVRGGVGGGEEGVVHERYPALMSM